ncbi:HAD family hydrolase [Marinobacter sp. CA1]|uniref:HAD family hydrolase n=1 Tax=Marinobacter sp. CA1 TaxID=2817656 RepID=UPI001D093096|nr:HAD family hydrolase [Marinobacter sp. CA1]UDL06126.1 HAD hydrolase-like protein [Marinobacter sp. CA1]
MAVRPNVVFFDVLETLINLAPLADRLEEVGQPGIILEPWFLRFQRDAMALTLAGDSAPFDAVAREALRTETRLTLSEREIEYVVDGFSTLPTFDDAVPALKKIADAGVAVGCLTVNSPERTRRFLEGAGLIRFVDHIVTAQDAGVWKPHPDIYRCAAQVTETPIERLALVAVHAWDCHGAKRAGAVAGWCARLEYEPGDVFLPADVMGETLVEVADKLMSLN